MRPVSHQQLKYLARLPAQLPTRPARPTELRGSSCARCKYFGWGLLGLQEVTTSYHTMMYALQRRQTHSHSFYLPTHLCCLMSSNPLRPAGFKTLMLASRRNSLVFTATATKPENAADVTNPPYQGPTFSRTFPLCGSECINGDHSIWRRTMHAALEKHHRPKRPPRRQLHPLQPMGAQ